jgi:hypothetical protein
MPSIMDVANRSDGTVQAVFLDYGQGDRVLLVCHMLPDGSVERTGVLIQPIIAKFSTFIDVTPNIVS